LYALAVLITMKRHDSGETGLSERPPKTTR
jgi:hypothetical protein